MTHRQPSANDPRVPGRPLDPEIARVLAAAGFTRRSFLKRAGAGGVLLASGGLLAACGIEGANEAAPSESAPPVTGSEAAPSEVASQAPEDPVLNVETWIEYIDPGKGGESASSPTLKQFVEQTGIQVDYGEGINGNNEYFAKIQAQLDAGEDIGEDIIVLTDWMAGRLIRLGWLSPLNKELIPNFANLNKGLQSPDFDPQRQFSLPWQSGLTGIGYNPKLIGREISSVNDLFDPALEGQVTFLTEMRDTMGVILAAMGFDPLNHEFSEYEQAIEKLQGAVDGGQVRAFTGNDYAADLAAGNIGAAIAWSGDVIQSQFENPDIKWVLPAEGALLWSDNMLVPANAQHPNNAATFMNFVYDPQVAAQIAAWVNYITPVAGAQEAMADIDESLVDNELIFPTEKTLSQTFDFKGLSSEEEREYEDLFQSVLGA